VKPNPDHIAVLEACVVNARALLDSAKAVERAGHHNIAFHLATLSLEELGKREIYQLQEAAKAVGDPPSWQASAVQDHVRKLFWCLYSLGTVTDIVDQQQSFNKRGAADDIHANRLAGLYVDIDDGALNIPSKAISPKQAAALIELADALVQDRETQKPREDIPHEELELQAWFLRTMDDPERRKRILTSKSFDMLKALNNVPAWTRQMKAELDAEDAELRALAERELQRSPTFDIRSRKARWVIRSRIETLSNSIRSRFIKEWNDKITWIKMVAVQGERKKEHLIVEFTLGDDVPIQALWALGFTLTLRLVIAMNLATSGFWWWQQAPNKTKYYDSIHDLENKKGVELEEGSFHIFQQRAAMTDVHARTLVMCFVALPDDPRDPQRGNSYAAYLGGLNFLALNSVTWRCEAWAFGQFMQAFRGLMEEAGYLRTGETISAGTSRFLNERFPELDRFEHAAFIGLIDTIQTQQTTSAKIGDVYLMKLLCETIFRDDIIPKIFDKGGPKDAPPV
jgi:AbiV family abortive infection protein